MKLIGIIGAGVMGAGVAQVFAQSGYKVALIDVSQEILNGAENKIRESLRLQGLFQPKESFESVESIMERIQFSMEEEILQDADAIVENANEDWGIKQSIYPRIDELCKESCVFLVNTSCISITKIAALTSRADKVLGVHFMNPVPMKKAVEVIRGFHTSDWTLNIVTELISNVGKESIVVNDYPGFVANRISHLMMNEAAFIVQDQVATAEVVDDIFKKCYGHAMGPLETADLIGLDVVVKSLKVLYESYQDSKFKCCPLLMKMVDAGLHGRKTGQGFYEY